MMFDDAITYAERDTLHGLLIVVDGATVVRRGPAAEAAGEPHALYSGTKSFWGIAAAAAADDGRIDLDEPVAATIPAWRDDPAKSRVTLRQLLSLTSGHGFGGLGNAVPVPAKALEIPLKVEPGTAFIYGGVPLQVFGEVLRRRLRPAFASPHDFLQERVLDRIGMRIDRWRTLADGSRPLPTGAFTRIDQWLRFGALLLAGGAGAVSAAGFNDCVTGSIANPDYGLGLWLAHRAGTLEALYASGAGGQGCYVLPARRLVAVRFGRSRSWNHGAFIRRLTSGS